MTNPAIPGARRYQMRPAVWVVDRRMPHHVVLDVHPERTDLAAALDPYASDPDEQLGLAMIGRFVAWTIYRDGGRDSVCALETTAQQVDATFTDHGWPEDNGSNMTVYAAGGTPGDGHLFTLTVPDAVMIYPGLDGEEDTYWDPADRDRYLRWLGLSPAPGTEETA